MRDHQRIKFVSLELWAGSKAKPRALLELDVDGVVETAEAFGDGPVDATFNAIQAIFPHQAELRLFSVGAVTEGTDAQARCTVRLEEERQTGGRPGCGYRHHRGGGAGLSACAQQADGEARSHGAGEHFQLEGAA